MRCFRPLAALCFALALLAAPGASEGQIAVGVSIRIEPPALPVYVQPPIPSPGYLWTPGYWAWGPEAYYWVPGTWVEPPAVGVLWTPGYWGWREGFYVWNGGYWGPHVGFYGGINYGFGYVGTGYAGGYWANGAFNYNRTVNNISNTNITNVYNQTVVNNTTVNNVSFNGGTGGTTAQPTPQEQAAAREHHTPATGSQIQHANAASTNRDLRASVNHGQPKVAATSTAGVFSGAGVSTAKGVKPNGPQPTAQVTGQPPNAAKGVRPNGPQPTVQVKGQPPNLAKGVSPNGPIAAAPGKGQPPQHAPAPKQPGGKDEYHQQ